MHGKTAYISGCIGLIPGADKPTLAGGGIEGQTRQCMENLKAVVEASGGKMINVCKTTVLLSGSMESYPVVNSIYAEYFPVNPPARAAFAVAGLPAGALIEIVSATDFQPAIVSCALDGSLLCLHVGIPSLAGVCLRIGVSYTRRPCSRPLRCTRMLQLWTQSYHRNSPQERGRDGGCAIAIVASLHLQPGGVVSRRS